MSIYKNTQHYNCIQVSYEVATSVGIAYIPNGNIYLCFIIDNVKTKIQDDNYLIWTLTIYIIIYKLVKYLNTIDNVKTKNPIL